ncbi:KRI1-like protein [Elsinoe fawcettii]|nr:KRI1-like protein [Elsinoe fawcettii]
MPRKSAERPAKRTKLLSDDEDSSASGDDAGGVPLTDDGSLKINEEFAKRFEHNKKREERHRLEEKYKRNGTDRRDDNAEDSDDSTSEEEDDDGELVTGELDNEIQATLKALKSRDPRIYDKKVNFYRPLEETLPNLDGEAKKEKPLYLKDYHRQNLLGGANGNEEQEDDIPATYDQEQDSLRASLVGQMHAAAADEESDDDGFLRKKTTPAHDAVSVEASASGVHPSRQHKVKNVDIEKADQDPETYLSNFMAARAWVPDTNSRFAHLDSDDSEDEKRAEEFEEAYNMRFEDPEKANAKLVSFARDMEKFSVRREEKTGRQKAREREREVKEAAKREKQEEKARLRKLRIEEVEEKVKMIKEAAGLGAADIVNLAEWKDVLEGDFDDDNWEKEMQKRFGDKYYAEKDDLLANDGEQEEDRSSKKVRKPKWDDDIDIKDLVPDFDEEAEQKPAFTLSDDENDEVQEGDEHVPMEDARSEKQKSRKELASEKKRADRKQRRQIESLVDEQLTTEPQSASAAGFRYRETSPVSYGLSARDILFADDTQLNTFAGLKKTHAFRDEEKKAKDRKKLGKKARLREWRRETFGNEEGYGGTFAEYVQRRMPEAEGKRDFKPYRKGQSNGADGRKEQVNGIVEGERKKKRKRKHQTNGDA